VARVLSLGVFVPQGQEHKLEILADTASLLGPTLSPAVVKPAPGPSEVLAAVNQCADLMAELGKRGDRPAARLAAALRGIAQGGPAATEMLSANLSGGISHRLDDLRSALSAAPVSLATFPPDFRRDWVAPDGRWRVQVFPRGDTRDNQVLRHFARAVQKVVPQAVARPSPWTNGPSWPPRLRHRRPPCPSHDRRPPPGRPAEPPHRRAGPGSSPSGGNPHARSGRRPRLFHQLRQHHHPAHDAGHRGGLRHLLRDAPPGRRARAARFAHRPGRRLQRLTTGTAFGSLALSRSPGMAEMGKFLGLALFFILACTLFFLPALLGVSARPAPGKAP